MKSIFIMVLFPWKRWLYARVLVERVLWLLVLVGKPETQTLQVTAARVVEAQGPLRLRARGLALCEAIIRRQFLHDLQTIISDFPHLPLFEYTQYSVCIA